MSIFRFLFIKSLEKLIEEGAPLGELMLTLCQTYKPCVHEFLDAAQYTKFNNGIIDCEAPEEQDADKKESTLWN